MKNSEIIAEMQKREITSAEIFFEKFADGKVSAVIQPPIPENLAHLDLRDFSFVFSYADEDSVDEDYTQEDYLDQEMEEFLDSKGVERIASDYHEPGTACEEEEEEAKETIKEMFDAKEEEEIKKKIDKVVREAITESMINYQSYYCVELREDLSDTILSVSQFASRNSWTEGHLEFFSAQGWEDENMMEVQDNGSDKVIYHSENEKLETATAEQIEQWKEYYDGHFEEEEILENTRACSMREAVEDFAKDMFIEEKVDEVYDALLEHYNTITSNTNCISEQRVRAGVYALLAEEYRELAFDEQDGKSIYTIVSENTDPQDMGVEKNYIDAIVKKILDIVKIDEEKIKELVRCKLSEKEIDLAFSWHHAHILYDDIKDLQNYDWCKTNQEYADAIRYNLQQMLAWDEEEQETLAYDEESET